jgi:PIN domain nuclease of toxin-antitoxin system
VKLLLDTQLLLWAAGGSKRITPPLRRLLMDARHELWFSAASLWEVAIKHSLGREDFRAEPAVLRRGLLDNGYQELAINGQHAVAVVALPAIHRDPFDRLLIAQAQIEGITLVTADEMLGRYEGPVRVI